MPRNITNANPPSEFNSRIGMIDENKKTTNNPPLKFMILVTSPIKKADPRTLFEVKS
ncbi:hypothetical protein WSS15_30260 [Acetobacter pasteurianus]|nr:hypothetical protein WSS15_30260 [Acetobacter pasteurianus]